MEIDFSPIYQLLSDYPELSFVFILGSMVLGAFASLKYQFFCFGIFYIFLEIKQYFKNKKKAGKDNAS